MCHVTDNALAWQDWHLAVPPRSWSPTHTMLCCAMASWLAAGGRLLPTQVTLIRHHEPEPAMPQPGCLQPCLAAGAEHSWRGCAAAETQQREPEAMRSP